MERFADDAEPFVPDDRSVMDEAARLADPEIDPIGHRIVFEDADRGLWVAAYDPVTGALDPPDGRGELVDTDVAPFGLLANGPEWAQAEGGARVVYARRRAGAWVLAQAGVRDGRWVTAEVDGVPDRVGSIGSQEPGDPDPRIVFVEIPTETVRWAHLDGRPGGVLVGFSGDVPLRTPRFTLGDRSLAWSNPIDGVDQVHHHDPDTGRTEVLTDDPDGVGSPWMWVAPEDGEARFLATRGSDAAPVALDVYRRLRGEWRVELTIWPPESHPFVASPEPWIAGGRSLLVFQATDSPEPGGDGQVWVAGATPGDALLHRVDDADGVPSDPEWAELGGEPAIFYSNRDAAGVHLRATSIE